MGWIHGAGVSIGLFYWLKWVVTCLMVIAVAWLHHIEHLQLRERLRRTADYADSEHILSLFVTRSLHMVALLVVIALAIIVHDLREIRSTAETAVVAPEPEPQTMTLSPLPVPQADSDLPFADITTFKEDDGNTRAYLDMVKQRYEKLLVTYYYLSQCKQATTDDFALLHSSMQADLDYVKAPSLTDGNILQAAQGTYSELYANSSCSGPDISSVKQSFDDSLTQLRQRQPKSGD